MVQRLRWVKRGVWVAGLLAVAVAGLMPVQDASGQARGGGRGGRGGNRNNNNSAVAQGENGYGVTDERVVEAIKKGVEYLLSTKKGDNWESGRNWTRQGQKGGQTAQALYALLTVADSIKDDPAFDDDFTGKLSYRSKELAPVVAWLCKQDLQETYANAFAALALTHITARSPEVEAALARIDAFMIASMGPEGGYQYANNQRGSAMHDAPPALRKAMVDRVDSAVALADLRSKLKAARDKKDAGAVAQLTPQVQAAEAACAKAELAVTRGSEGGLAQATAAFNQARGISAQADARRDNLKGQRDAARKNNNGRLAQQLDPQVDQAVKDADRARNELKPLEDAFHEADAAAKAGRNDDQFGDISNTQYGSYAMQALCEAGFEAPKGYWQISDKYWRKYQLPDGGWGYAENSQGLRENMALAGVASLYITQEFSTLPVSLTSRKDENIERGLGWLNKEFRPKGDDMYYMYGVERIGLASGLKYFNQTNWYMEGVKGALASQNGDGSWDKSSHAEGEASVGTAFALLFLVRGRNPVLFNKLEYEGSWDARPRDNANITDWINKKLEKNLNWQIINMKTNPEEWLDAPVLLITGSKELKFTDEDIKKLRTYINAGGMIFSTADGGAAEFTDSVKKIASKLVEEDGKAKYEMRELGKDDRLFSKEMWAQITKPVKVLSMSNGVREIWVHSTMDMGGNWQGKRIASSESFEFPANLFRYASGKSTLRSKLSSLAIVGGGTTTRTINVARLDYAGNWDPEPGAFPRLAKIMKRDAKTDLQIKPTSFAALDPRSTPVAHMTGTTGFPVNADAAASLKKFIDGGGTLIVDAAGGSSEFRISFEKLLQQVSPGAGLGAIPLTSPVYNGTVPDAVDATKVDYRMAYRLANKGKGDMPQLKGVLVGSRYAVIYSEEDIISGLLGTNTWGIMGYTADSAQMLMRNLILYGANPKAGKEGPGVGEAAAAGG